MMNDYLVECVPNISEGRDPKKVQSIVEAILAHGVHVLHTDSGYDAHRTVLTIVGPISKMINAIKTLYHHSADSIDMSIHHGEHPRIGAVDVCPFIPFDEKKVSDLKARVNELAHEISEELKVPIFLYKKSSLGDTIKSLPAIRRGEYEQLISDPSKMKYKADYGSAYISPSFGGAVMGVRDFMIAYNINLNTPDLPSTKELARRMRTIRKEQGQYKGKNIEPLQILGWYMDEYNCCQISTNIHNPRELSMVDVYHFTTEMAQQMSVEVVSSELIGMVPEFALDMCKVGNIRSDDDVISALGLDFKGAFDWEQKVLERRVQSIFSEST